jgi:hypothetical protein
VQVGVGRIFKQEFLPYNKGHHATNLTKSKADQEKTFFPVSKIILTMKKTQLPGSFL